MRITKRAEYEVTRPIEEVFDFVTATESFSKFMLPSAIIPGVDGARMVDAAAPKAQARREIYLTDGSTIEEELLDFDRPTRQHYRWLQPPAPPFSWLVRRGEGDWVFTATPAGTHIVWVYHFELTSPFAIIAALPVLALFQRWMQSGLERVPSALAEAE